MTIAEVQRQLAAEFDRRGWEYDLATARAMARAVDNEGTLNPDELAKLAPPSFLSRAGIRRVQLSEAIEHALSGLSLEESGGSVIRPITILFVAAGPTDEGRLRLGAEHRAIKERIRSSSVRDRVAIEEDMAAQPTALVDAINRARPTILHLASHGSSTGLAFEGDDGLAVDVSTSQLVNLVEAAGPELRLVVLNSCDSAHQAAPIVQHVDAAIGMTRAIGDDSARAFAAQLYSSLAEGVDLERAMRQAKLQISLSGLPDQDIPQLFVRTGMDPQAMTLLA